MKVVLLLHAIADAVSGPLPLPLIGAAARLPTASTCFSLPKGFLLLLKPAWPPAQTRSAGELTIPNG